MATPVAPIVLAPVIAAAPAAPPISGFVTVMGVTINPMVGVLMVSIGLFGFILWRGQRDNGKNTFDIWDLLMQPRPDGGRIASSAKMGFMGAFIVSTWLLIDQEIKSSPLLPAIFTVYMATWGTAFIANVIYGAKTMPTLNLPGAKKDADQ